MQRRSKKLISWPKLPEGDFYWLDDEGEVSVFSIRDHGLRARFGRMHTLQIESRRALDIRGAAQLGHDAVGKQLLFADDDVHRSQRPLAR